MHTNIAPVSNQEIEHLRPQSSPLRSVIVPSSRPLISINLLVPGEILSSTFTAMKLAWFEVAALTASVTNASVSPIQMISNITANQVA